MSESQLSRYRSITEQNGYPSVPVTTIFPRDPETITDTTQIVMVPGWGESRESLQGVASTLAREGRVVTIYDNPRIPRKTDVNELKTRALRGVMQHLQAEQYPLVLVPHSQGMISAVRAANQVPEQVRAISAIAPAALAGTLRGIELTGRAIKEALVQPSRAIGLGRVALYAAGHVLKNAPSAWSEICAIAQTNVMEDLKQVRDNGIPVTVVLCENDQLFLLDEVRQNLQAIYGDELPNVHTIGGSHIGLFENPEVVRLAYTAMQGAPKIMPQAA